jgi:ArsR family transcriptional regulator, arsenate/arsenite/antimonite-responsive transcriptional repressor
MWASYRQIEGCQYDGRVDAGARSSDRATDPEVEDTMSEPVELGCCEPFTESALDERSAVELAAVFKALADPVRLRLLSIVASAATGEACACDLTAPVGRSQPTVSHHMAALVDAGLVLREQRGRWAWYRLNAQRVDQVRGLLGTESLSR